MKPARGPGVTAVEKLFAKSPAPAAGRPAVEIESLIADLRQLASPQGEEIEEVLIFSGRGSAPLR
jgi:hypothetical protein